MKEKPQNAPSTTEDTTKNWTDEDRQEYINKLQAGKLEIDPANRLEHETCKKMREKQKLIQQASDGKNQAEKQAEQIAARIKSLESDINVLAGELSGYAQILVWAEDQRRSGNVSTTPVQSEPATVTQIKKKPGPKPGIQPKHLQAVKGNGKPVAAPIPEATKPEAPGDDEPEGDEDSDSAN